MTSPAAILAKALKSHEGPALAKLAHRAGVPREIAQRAANGANGQPTRANYYLRLCAVLGLDAMTGARIVPWEPGDADLTLFAMGFKMRRFERNHDIYDAAKTMRASATAVSRIENAGIYSFEMMAAACRYARLDALNYLMPPVSRVTLTRNRNSAADQIHRSVA